MIGSEEKSVDRRRHPRQPMATGVQFYHPTSDREFPARTIDISESGLLMYVPASTPVRPGEPIRLKVAGVNRPEFASISKHDLDAKVVRVNRNSLLSEGYLSVGVEFSDT